MRRVPFESDSPSTPRGTPQFGRLGRGFNYRLGFELGLWGVRGSRFRAVG